MTQAASEPCGATRALADFAFGSHSRVANTSRPLAWLSPDEMAIDLSDAIQRRFGDYELIEKIGQGGMGVVYRARQHGLERDVAIKLLAAGPWASEEFVARFRREARSAARMQHPNIVEVYEFGHRDGLNYFSMRLIEGRTLAQRIAAKGPLPALEAARLLRTLAEAMDYAHRLGVLHLDLKPANVLLTQSGEPLIADFGLARRIDAGHDGATEISGTPSYMAPEQALLESHPLTASTDIYGLGAVLYEVLTGRPPFHAGSAQSTLERVIAGAPTPPRQLDKRIPADLEAICLKCLQLQPADRYASARALAEDLRNFTEGLVVSVRRPGPVERLRRWSARNPAQLAMWLVLAAGIAATTQQMLRADAAAREARNNAAKVETALGLLVGLTAEERVDPSRVDAMVTLVTGSLKDKPEVGADLLEMLGFSLSQRSPKAALPVLDAALALSTEAHGPNDERTESIIRLHGWAAHNSGDIKAAENYYRRWVDFIARNDGTESVEHAHWAPHLALVLLDQGKPEEAEQWARPALRILEEKHGPGRDWTMLAAYALGRARLDQGQPAEAEALLQRAAKTYESLYAYDEGIAIYCRYYLGLAIAAQGRTTEGRALADRSVDEAADHPNAKLMGRSLLQAIAAQAPGTD